MISGALKIIKELAHRIKPYAKAKNLNKLELELNQEETRALYDVLFRLMVYYEFKEAQENDQSNTDTKLPES